MIAQALTPEILEFAAQGALGGAAIFVCVHVIGHAKGWIYRLKRDRRIASGDTSALLEPESLKEAEEGVVGKGEQGFGLFGVIPAAVAGALFYAGWQSDNIVLPALAGVLIAGLPLVQLLRKEPDDVMDSGSEKDEDTDLFANHGWALAAAAFALLAALLQLPGAWEIAIGWLKMIPSTVHLVAWPIIALALFVNWLSRHNAGAPEDVSDVDSWESVTALMLIASMLITIGWLLYILA